MRHLWAILLISAATLPVLLGMSSAGVAQSSDPQPRLSDDGPPPGGCTPIGVTVSGEVVFPMTCRDFIERHKAADRAATAAETKPATAEASKAPDAVEADKALTTGDASKAPATADVGSAPAAVEASKAPTAPNSGKPDEKDAKPAAAKAPADEEAKPVTKQAAVAPADHRQLLGRTRYDRRSIETHPSPKPRRRFAWLHQIPNIRRGEQDLSRLRWATPVVPLRGAKAF